MAAVKTNVSLSHLKLMTTTLFILYLLIYFQINKDAYLFLMIPYSNANAQKIKSIVGNFSLPDLLFKPLQRSLKMRSIPFLNPHPFKSIFLISLIFHYKNLQFLQWLFNFVIYHALNNYIYFFLILILMSLPLCL